MLNMTKVELKFISDVDIHLFFDKDMRGAVSYISKRYSKASNKYLNLNTKNRNQNILNTWTLTICMVMLCLNFFQ